MQRLDRSNGATLETTRLDAGESVVTGSQSEGLAIRQTAFDRQLAEPSALDRLKLAPDIAERLVVDDFASLFDDVSDSSLNREKDLLQVTAEVARMRELVDERLSVIEIVIDSPITDPFGDDGETNHDEVGADGNGGQNGVSATFGRPPAGSGINPAPLQPTPVTLLTHVLPNTPGARRVGPAYAEVSQVPRTTLAFEAAPEWVRTLPRPAAAAISLLLYPRELGDVRVFEFPIDNDIRVILDGTMRGPSRIEIDGTDTGILVHPVYDDAGEIKGFAPDSFYDQHELQARTGAWVALSENGSVQDAPVVRVGAGSVIGAPREAPRNADARQLASVWLENRTGVLIAGEQGRHLERVPEIRGVSTPDYIDINTGERIDIYCPDDSGRSIRSVRAEAFRKFNRDQADSVVINLGNNDHHSVDELLRAIQHHEDGRPTTRQGDITVIDQMGNFHYIPANATVPRDQSQSIGDRE